MTNTIHPSLLLSSVQSEREVKDGSSLGKDEFLQILITQLQNQDPTNPMQDREFIAQMATFSSLEQMMNLSESFDKFVQQELTSSLLNYQQLIGKDVSYVQILEGKEGLEVVEGKGKVLGIEFIEGQILLNLEDGTTITPGDLTEINQFSTPQSIVDASHMIGLTVTWLDEAGTEITSLIEAVSYKNGELKFLTADEKSITQDQIVKVLQGE
ncbi:flagellar basal-body rod modification protein FlgD [Bacillus oleivorans]|uniref:Basal-body rod modification protein FlgD n=1 Tax=Bacillus oleivorans TaxID=1448271 RepID=A0A285D2W6_9BACI|nr:flagellar hook assembly protein FlgD [Bacillus oleivorans]SNX73656.1 flagellar basal-body rod modification protein FlgD [Bacillus oleivorans]